MMRQFVFPLVVLAVVAFCAIERAFANGWRAAAPANWLGVVTCSDLEDAESLVATALDDLNYQYASPLPGLAKLLGTPRGFGLANAEIVIGWARHDAGDQPYLFAMLPVEKPAEWIALLGGEINGPIGSGRIGGQDVVFAPCGNWVVVAPIVAKAHVSDIGKRPPATVDAKAEPPVLGARVSAAGLNWLAQRARDTAHNVRKRSLSGGTWPPRLAYYDAALLQNEPLMQAAADTFDEMSLRVARTDAGALRAVCCGSLKQPVEVDATSDPPKLPPMPNAALVVSGDVKSSATQLAWRLWLAYSKGRPDAIDAYQYDSQAYDAFEQAMADATDGVQSFTFGIDPQLDEDKPFHANQLLLLNVRNVDAAQRAAMRVTEAWNSVAERSSIQLPVVFSIEPFAEDDYEGILFDCNLLKTLAGEGGVELRSILERFFGAEGHYQMRLVTLGPTKCVLSDIPWPDLKPKLDAFKKAAGAPVEGYGSLRIELHPGPWINWQQRTAAALRTEPGDLTVPKTLLPAAPTVTADVRIEDGALEIETIAPRDAVEVVGQWLSDR